MAPDLALAIALEALKAFNHVWSAMTPEQQQYWLKLAEANDKAVREWVNAVCTSLGLPPLPVVTG